MSASTRYSHPVTVLLSALEDARSRGLGLLLLLSLGSACSPVASSTGETPHAARDSATTLAATPALDLGAITTVEQIIPALAEARVVFVGEQHDRYDHHLIQLEIIRRLHRNNPRLAIGMEMFQQPFQSSLDDYIAGTISEQEMLRATEYYQRWRIDYRLYAPILRYAREHQLAVIALNLPVEITRQVGRLGLDGLSGEQRARLPADIDRSDRAYEQRIKTVFEQHPNDNGQDFAHFLEVQLVWDEGMAERAAVFLETHPDHQLVVLAGAAHVAYGSSIPRRMTRRIAVDTAVVLNSWNGPPEPELADYLLWPGERALPQPGRIGATLEEQENTVRITACMEDSACAGAGMRAGDRITAIDRQSVKNIADLRLALWDKQPGDTVTVEVLRRRGFLPSSVLNYEITLQ